MRIIYIDLHFLINLLLDYLLCLAAGRFSGLRLRRGRYLIAAVFGAVYSVLVLLPGFTLLNLPASRLLSALLMGLIAYGGEARPLRCCFAFMAVSAAFGGAVWALSLGAGESLLPLSLRTLLLAFALCYCALSIFFKDRGKLPERPRVSVRLSFLEKTTEFTVLLDSGNCLSDPISGAAVMSVCPKALHALGDEFESLSSLEPVELMQQSEKSPSLKGRFRLVPFSSLGGSGMLAAFRPESLYIDGKARQDVIVAISKNAQGEGFEGLF